MCGLAFALDAPLVLVPVGIIYIAETLSDIIQVVYFKLTHGKRIFRMAPYTTTWSWAAGARCASC